jgi:protein translocase subunit secG
MQTVLIVIHLMVVIALVGVVLLQRSEGGALGVGGGSGFMTGRGQANVLTRATAILAAIFFVDEPRPHLDGPLQPLQRFDLGEHGTSRAGQAGG